MSLRSLAKRTDRDFLKGRVTQFWQCYFHSGGFTCICEAVNDLWVLDLVSSNGFKNVRNVIQIALKLLFFAKKSQKLPNGQTLFCNTLELRLVCSTRRLNETSFEQMDLKFGFPPLPFCKSLIPRLAGSTGYIFMKMQKLFALQYCFHNYLMRYVVLDHHNKLIIRAGKIRNCGLKKKVWICGLANFAV